MTVEHKPTDFQTACGARGPLRLAVACEGSKGAMVRELAGAHVLIGRDPACAICLEHKSVESRHAYLQVLGGHVFCLDLGSRCGTHWENGSEGSGWLRAGHSIRIGPFRIRLQDAPDQDGVDQVPAALSSPLERLPSEQDPLPEVVLNFVEGASEPTRWRMRQALVLLGKSSRCKIQLGGSDIQRFHGSLVRTPHSVWFVGFGGVAELNGVSVHLAKLADGDVLRVGKFDMRLAILARQSPDLATPGLALVPAALPPANLPVASPVNGASLPAPPLHLSRSESHALACLGADMVPAPWLQLLGAASVANGLQGSGPAMLSALDFERLLSQINLMQQQMAVQHMQLMTGLCQVLGTLLKDERGDILEELARFQEATRELQSLQAQLLQIGAEPAEDLPESGAGAPMPSSPTESAEITLPVTAQEPVLTNGSAEPPAPRPSKSTAKPPHVHSFLIERMTALQNEQQSRWQKILGAVRHCIPGAGI